MSDKEAILGFMMGERIKSGLIAASSMLSVVEGLPSMEKRGAERVVSVYIGYLAAELGIAGRVSPREEWAAIAGHLEQAQVKIDSGIASEAIHDLTAAVSKAATVSHRTMTYLQERGLLS